MNILITGVNGSLGQEIARLILEKDYKLFCIVRENQIDHTFNKWDKISSVIGNSKKDISNLLSKEPIDSVIHCSTNYGHKSKLAKIINDNVVFPINLLESCFDYNIPLFINTDTFLNKGSIKYKKLHHYANSKKSFLNWLDNDGSTRIVTLRLEHTYGPNDREQKFVSSAINDIALKKLPCFSATFGEHERDFIDVRDAALAYMTVLENKERIKQNVYEIGTGIPTKIKDCLELIKSISKSQTKIDFGAIPLKPEDNYTSYSNSNFNSDFSWKSSISLNSGLSHYIKVKQRLVQCY
jgi:nucleoside-diphosphate-sugar epimerase